MTMSLLRRCVALASSTVLLSAGVGMAMWAARTPAAPTTPIAPLTLRAPSHGVVDVCPAGPGNTLGAVDLGDTDTATMLARVGEDAAITYADEPITDATRQIGSADGGILAVHTDDGTDIETGTPLAVGIVTTTTTSGDLRGFTVAPCRPPVAHSWIVGGSGTLGSSAELRLTNPGATTVTATVRLYGSTGQLTLPSGGQVAVPAGQTSTMLLESAADTDPRLAVAVDTDGGTLVTSLASESLDGETPAGTDVLTSAGGPATDLVIPGVVLTSQETAAVVASSTDTTTTTESADSAGAQTGSESAGSKDATSATANTGSATVRDARERGPVLRIVNPNETDATVAVTLLGEDGASPLPGASSLVIDPGAVFDVSLTGVPAGAYGLRLSSDIPIHAAARLVRVGNEYPQRSGTRMRDIAWIQAQDATATQETTTLALPAHRSITAVNKNSATLTLTNPNDVAATLTLRRQGTDWTDTVTVPARSTTAVDVTSVQNTAPGALTILGSDSTSVHVGLVFTQDVDGTYAGTLIAVLTAVQDITATTARALQWR